MENQAWYFRPKAHNAERTDANGETYPEPLNGLLNTVARFEVSRLSQWQFVYDRVAMAYVDYNSYEIQENPESVDSDVWDCCFIQLSYGQPNQTLKVCLTAFINKQAEISLCLRCVCGLSCLFLHTMAETHT